MEKLTNSNTSDMEASSSNKQLIRQFSKLHSDFDHERIILESDPDCIEAADSLSYPDLLVKGIKNKTYKTTGKGLQITLDKLQEFKLSNFLNKRKYIRLAFLRVVWIPTATDLPGRVRVGMKDLRAVEDRQVIDSKQFSARGMHNYSYQQEVYTHKKEINKMAIFVLLEDYQSKYTESDLLGTVRIYWVLHSTNMATLHEKSESMTSLMRPMRMPSLTRLDFVSRPRASTASITELDLNKDVSTELDARVDIQESKVESQEAKDEITIIDDVIQNSSEDSKKRVIVEITREVDLSSDQLTKEEESKIKAHVESLLNGASRKLPGDLTQSKPTTSFPPGYIRP